MLALGYPDCWTYAVDGLIGSSPETLIRADHGDVNARVLAGTISRGADAGGRHRAARVALAHLGQGPRRARVRGAERAGGSLAAHTLTLIAARFRSR